MQSEDKVTQRRYDRTFDWPCNFAAKTGAGQCKSDTTSNMKIYIG